MQGKSSTTLFFVCSLVVFLYSFLAEKEEFWDLPFSVDSIVRIIVIVSRMWLSEQFLSLCVISWTLLLHFSSPVLHLCVNCVILLMSDNVNHYCKLCFIHHLLIHSWVKYLVSSYQPTGGFVDGVMTALQTFLILGTSPRFQRWNLFWGLGLTKSNPKAQDCTYCHSFARLLFD